MNNPLILDIKGNSLDDGSGIRTVVFFKGCPLRCVWCHNPESKKQAVELSFSQADCIGCGSCRAVCPQEALNALNPNYVDRQKCSLCFRCTEECPAKALTRVGDSYSIEALMEKILSDKPFYDVSGGGVTLSGGEATLYPEFAGALLKRCRKSGVKSLLETCGLFGYDEISALMLPYIDQIYFDIKIYNRELHKKYCGAYNDIILQNFKKLSADAARFGFELLPRTPLIPDITDTDENLIEIADFLSSLRIKRAALLPYNPTWFPKGTKLGLADPPELAGFKSWQSSEKTSHCKQIFMDRNISV